MTTKKRILLAGVAVALIAGVGAAAAQEVVRDQSAETGYSNFKRDRSISVRQRPHPGYEALGLREGALMIWPKLNATVEYNDNIYANAVKESDTIWHVSPEVDLTSNWARHALSAYARATINRYSDFSTEDSEDYAVGGNLRLDVLRTAQINGGANWSSLTEPRTSPSTIGQAKPNQYELTTGFLSGAREFNRLRVSGRVDAQNFIYLNQTGNRQQHDRDRTVAILTGRADYAVSPDTALFFQVAGNKHDYRLGATPSVLATYPGFLNRDSSGVEALVGANFELSAVMRGEVGVGYLSQSYDNAAFKDNSGFGARAQVEWFPTQLTTVTLIGSRTIEDAGIPGSSGYLSTNIGAAVDHELLRNVIVSAQAGYGNDDYRGVVGSGATARAMDHKDTRYTVGISGTYLLNRSVGVTVGYNYLDQESKGRDATGSFKVNKIGATVTLQY